MDRLRENNVASGKYIIWCRAYSGRQCTTGRIAHVGGPTIDEWGKIPIWVVWDDLHYVIEYDENLVPEKLNYMSSKHVLNILCGVEVYIFDSEQERLLGLLKLSE